MPNPPFKRFWPLIACALLALTVLLWWQSRPATSKPAPTAATATPRPAATQKKQPDPAPADDPNDPRTALAAALEQADPRLRSQQFGQLLAQWIARDP